jgi:hypothetical protein
MKQLKLNKEVLAELTADEMSGIAGAAAAESYSCPITYKCVGDISNNCFNSIVCKYIDVGGC